jgi:gamma-glutamyltranspeptidase/glutathione hydrolase
MRPLLLLSLLALLLPAPPTVAARDLPQPEAATGWQDRGEVTARRYMVVAANPLAAQAGREILSAGGGAVDAAVAVQMVLTLVEPQSSGVGGGGFLMHWDAGGRKVEAFDGRETAPAAARPDRFLNPDGSPMPFMTAVVGGHSVGVPGVVRMLELAHRQHGRLPWALLFAPAIRLAEQGFALSPRLHGLLAGETALRDTPAARALYYQADGSPKPVGTVIRNPELAESLRLIAAGGADALHRGPLAERIVATVAAAPRHPGDLTLADLAGYQAKRREPVCGSFRVWTVCSMPPPSTGGIALLQILGILQTFPPQSPMTVPAAHLTAEAEKLAFADRGRYVADADFVPVPMAELLAPDYLRRRAALIDPHRAMDHAAPGDLSQRHGWADDASPELPSTSHFSIVDAQGNAAAMTTSIENGFGSRLMVGGFLLNNHLTDFSARPEVAGRPVANRLEPGKRPRSAMSPTLVFDATGRLVLVTGSPGGSRIIGFVARDILAVLDGGLSPQAAAAVPHVVNRNGPTELEQGTAAETLRAPLEALGHVVELTEMTSGLHLIAIGADGLLRAGVDPRREGAAAGQ